MWELAVAIGVPGIGALYAFVRYLHKRAICFTIMQNKINTLSEHDQGSEDKHVQIDSRLTTIEGRQAKNEIYLKLVMDKMDIKYSN